MAKRKRDSLPPTASPAATARSSAAPSEDEDRAHVVVQLADGSKVWRGKLKSKRTFDQWVPKIVERLGVSASPEMRVLHVRDGGKEVEIVDDIDFSALKSRAASTTTPLTVKIYTPSTSHKQAVQAPQTPTPAAVSKTPTNTPATAQKTKKKSKNEHLASAALPSTPASSKKDKGKAKAIPQPDLPPAVQTDRPPQPLPTASPASSTKTKKRKRDSTSSNAEEAPASSTPGPSQPAQASRKSPSPTQPKKKPRKRHSQISTPPASPKVTPALSLSVPSPAAVTGNPFQFTFSPAAYNKYKPVKPSPLGRMDNPMESEGDKTDKEGGKKARKPRKKKEKAAAAASEASSAVKSVIAVPSVPASSPSTPAKEVAAPAPSPSTPATPEAATPSKTRKPRAKATPKPETPKVSFEIMRKHREKLAAEAAAKETAKAGGVSVPDVPTPSEAPVTTQAQATPKKKASARKSSVDTTSSSAPAPAPALSQPSSPAPTSKTPKDKAPAKPKPGPRASLAAEIAAQILRESEEKKAAAEAAKEKEVEMAAESDAIEADAVSSLAARPSTSNVASVAESSPSVSQSGKKKRAKKGQTGDVVPANPETGGTETGAEKEQEEPQEVAQMAERQPEVDVQREPEEEQTAGPVAPEEEQPAQLEDVEVRPEELAQNLVPEPTQASLPPPKQPECVICRGPSHPQVECDVVKAGVPRLREVLAERRTDEDSEAAVKAIEMWIQRLERIANAVTGASPKPSTPKRVNGSSKATPTQAPVAAPLDDLASNEKAASNSSASDASKSPTPPASPPPLPDLPPIYHKALSRKAGPGSAISVSDAVIETGSSASDTESESESESGSDSEGSRSDGSTRSTRARSSSTSSSSSSASSRGSPSPPPPDLSSLDPGAALRHFLTAPLSQRQRRAARDSAAHMHVPGPDDEDEPEVAEASDVDSEEERRANGSFHRGKDDDEESLVDGYGMDEDEKEDESVADEEEQRHSVPVITQDQEPGQSGDERAESVEDIEDSESFEAPAPTQIEPIEQEPEPMDVDIVTQFPTPEKALDGDVQTPPASSQLSQTFETSRRSFSDLAALASPGAPTNQLPGDVAIRDTINEEDPAQSQGGDEPSIEIEISSSNTGLMSPPASAGLPLAEDASALPATQMVSESQPEAVTLLARPPPPRRSTRQSSRQPSMELARSPDLRPAVTFQVSHVRNGGASSPPLDLPPSSFPENSQPDVAPPIPSRRRLRSASREPPPPEAAPAPRSRSTRSSSRQLEVPSTPQPPVRRSTRRNVSSQSNEAGASQPEPTPLPTRRSSRRQTTPLASSQIDQLDPSSPPATRKEVVEESPLFIAETQVPESQGESQESQTQKDVGRFWKYGGSQESPLFMSQGSQYPQTQAYNICPSLGSSDTDATPKAKTAAQESSPTNGVGDARRNSMLRLNSPILEEEEEEEGAGEKDGPTPNAEDQSMDRESNASSDDEEDTPMTSIPIPRPASQPSQSVYPSLKQLPHPASQGSSFPTLSSLPREVLRGFTSMFAAPSKSQPESNNKEQGSKQNVAEQMHGVGDDSESETSGDSSEEEQEPEKLRGRFAGVKAKKAKAVPVVKGW
ncbi:hypothetical protein IAR50_000475 [Cryptococcus sp. DSM 104548]